MDEKIIYAWAGGGGYWPSSVYTWHTLPPYTSTLPVTIDACSTYNQTYECTYDVVETYTSTEWAINLDLRKTRHDLSADWAWMPQEHCCCNIAPYDFQTPRFCIRSYVLMIKIISSFQAHRSFFEQWLPLGWLPLSGIQDHYNTVSGKVSICWDASLKLCMPQLYVIRSTHTWIQSCSVLFRWLSGAGSKPLFRRPH